MRLIAHFLVFGIIIIVVLLYNTTRSNDFPPEDRNNNLLIVTDSLKTLIEDVVRRDSYIVGLQIVTIDFKHNKKIETYVVIDNTALNEIYQLFVETTVIDIPLFREDRQGNSNTLRLMNGEFVCIPFKDSSAYRYAPTAEAYVKYVCGIAIPPNQYNNFSGILTLYLNNIPSEQVLGELFIFARSTSLRIAQDNENLIER